MERKNPAGMTLMEQGFFILFSDGNEKFVFFMLKKVPDARKHLYKVNASGWLPVFRVLHLFERSLYQSEKQKRNHDIAQ